MHTVNFLLAIGELASGDFTPCVCSDEHVLVFASVCQSVAFQAFLPGPLGENVLLKYIQAMPLWRFFAFLFTNLMFQNKNNKQTKSKPELKKKKKPNKQSKNKTA
jgi:hypothetical protein